MSGKELPQSGEPALKPAGGTADGTAEIDPAVPAATHAEIPTDDQGRTQWIVRHESGTALADGGTVDVQNAREHARESQASTVETLSSRDSYTVDDQFWLLNELVVTAEKAPETARRELSRLPGVTDVRPKDDSDTSEGGDISRDPLSLVYV